MSVFSDDGFESWISYLLGCITNHCARCSFDFIVPVSLETDWHVSLLENLHSHPAPDNQMFEITMGVKKIRRFNSFNFGV